MEAPDNNQGCHVLIKGMPGAGMPSLPVAQPRNVFGGMMVSCVAGLFWRTMLGKYVWVSAPLAAAFSILGMQITATLHRAPPHCSLFCSTHPVSRAEWTVLLVSHAIMRGRSRGHTSVYSGASMLCL